MTIASIVLVLLGLGSLVCWILVLIPLFKENVGLGILGIICGIFTFIWGWVKAKEKGLTKIMTYWTILTVAYIIVYAVFVGTMVSHR